MLVFAMEEEVIKKVKSQRKRKLPESPPVEVGCFDLLKNLSCSVQCGGKIFSVAESEPSLETPTTEIKEAPSRRKKWTKLPKLKRKRLKKSPLKKNKKQTPDPSAVSQ